MKLRHFIVLLLIILSASTVSALVVMQDSVCYVGSDDVVEGNLYALCRDLIIDGVVEGSVFAISVHSELNGRINNNVYMISGDLIVNGKIVGDLHFGGGVLQLNSDAEFEDTQLVSIALSAVIEPEATIPSYVSSFGYQLIVEGNIGRDIDFWGSALRITGEVGGDVNATVGNMDDSGTGAQIETVLVLFPFEASLIDPGLHIIESASIEGDLSYSAFQPIDPADTVKGDINYTALTNTTTLDDLADEENRISAFSIYLQNLLREFVTLSVIGVLGLLLWPEVTRSPLTHLGQSPLSGIGVGLLTFIISFPFFLLVLIFSIIITVLLAYLPINGIGLTAGVIFGMFNIGGASLFYFMAIYLSRTIVAIALGRIVLYQTSFIDVRFSWFVGTIVGALLLASLVALPVIGWVVNAISLFLGLGAILKVLQVQFNQFRQKQVQQTMPSVDVSRSTPPPPPALDDKIQNPPGMDNLPSGFAWWANDED